MTGDVIVLVRTDDLIYDDRVRKEALSLAREGWNVHLLVVDKSNAKQEGVTSYGIPYTSYRLLTRLLSPQGKFLTVKVLEMYAHMLKGLHGRRPEMVWVHNMEMTGLLPILCLMRRLGRIGRIVWDQHEIPAERTLRNPMFRSIIEICMAACDLVVFPSRLRERYWRSIWRRKRPLPSATLANYPDRDFCERQSHVPAGLQDWMQGSGFLLAQGGTAPRRHFSSIVEAVMELREVKLVAVGRVPEGLEGALEDRYGNRVWEWVRLTGLVPQMEMVNYIDAAVGSIILYESTTLNSRLCAPNRLYQALGRGTPVIVGSNKGMAGMVEREGVGVVLDDDGRRTEVVARGIRRFLTGRDEYAAAFANLERTFLWECQELPPEAMPSTRSSTV